MKLPVESKYRPLFSIFEDIEKYMNYPWWGWTMPATSGYWLPAIDVKEEVDRYVVRADIPGVEAKNMHISIDQQNNLVIEGERESEFKTEEKGYVRLERSKGSFYRKLSLPQRAEAENIKAKYKDGVLEITIPKAKKTTAKQIKIES